MKTKREPGFNPAALQFRKSERTPMLIYREGGVTFTRSGQIQSAHADGALARAAQPGPWGSSIMAYFTSLDYVE